MGNTKFVVIKARELIKTAVFAVLGVIILVGLITFFLHMGTEEDGAYRDGTYYGELALGKLGEEKAEVAVTIAEGKIADVSLEQNGEVVTVFYPLLEAAAEEVGREVVETQSLTIAVSKQNAASAQAVLDAVAQGLEQAKK